MRPFTSTIPFAEALRQVLAAARPIDRTEQILLAAADGRVVAADVHATVDVPAFDRSAMDGYAVVAADTIDATPDRPRSLACVARAFTGQMPSRAVMPGECVEIATGAPMPAGADAVVMVEETAPGDAGIIRVRARVQPRQNVGPRASDLAQGQRVVRAGQSLTPSRVGALAATGLTHVDVYAKPKVALISTGDEVVDPGQPLEPGQVYNINRVTMQSVVARHGGEAVALRTSALHHQHIYRQQQTIARQGGFWRAPHCEPRIESGNTTLDRHPRRVPEVDRTHAQPAEERHRR